MGSHHARIKRLQRAATRRALACSERDGDETIGAFIGRDYVRLLGLVDALDRHLAQVIDRLEDRVSMLESQRWLDDRKAGKEIPPVDGVVTKAS